MKMIGMKKNGTFGGVIRFTPDVIFKMRAAKVGISGKNHPSWKGETALYGSKHDWIERHAGHAKKCMVCGFESENHRKVEWCNISLEYKRDLSDYISLCRKCHRKWDYGVIVLKINGQLYKRPLVFKGYGSVKHYKKWMAQTCIDGKHHYLGLHNTKEMADRACINFRNKFSPKMYEVKL